MNEEEQSEQKVDEAAAVSGEFEHNNVSPGHLVQRERERQAMSVEALAESASLSLSVVEALEGEQFDALPDRVYVRGYYRKCARVLGMAEQTLMDAYTHCHGAEDPHAALAGHVQIQDMPRGGPPRRLFPFKWLVVIVLLVIAGVLVWAWLPGITNTLSGRNSGHVALIDTPPVASKSQSNPGESQSRSAKPQLAPEHSGESDISSRTSKREAQKPVIHGSLGGAVQRAETADSVTDETTARSQPEQGTVTDDEDVVLKFQERSWIRVRDGNGAILINGIITAGETRVLTGLPPYSIELGYAPGVDILVNDESVDLSRYVEANNTADLTLRPGSQ